MKRVAANWKTWSVRQPDFGPGFAAFNPMPLSNPGIGPRVWMITIAERPDAERQAWQAYFDHYVFRSHAHPLAHLPA